MTCIRGGAGSVPVAVQNGAPSIASTWPQIAPSRSRSASTKSSASILPTTGCGSFERPRRLGVAYRSRDEQGGRNGEGRGLGRPTERAAPTAWSGSLNLGSGTISRIDPKQDEQGRLDRPRRLCTSFAARLGFGDVCPGGRPLPRANASRACASLVMYVSDTAFRTSRNGSKASAPARQRPGRRANRSVSKSRCQTRLRRQPCSRVHGCARHLGHNGAVFSPSVENLVAQLTRLPGIGQRTAQRLAFHILQRPPEEALALAAALTEVKERASASAPRVREPDRGGDVQRSASTPAATTRRSAWSGAARGRRLAGTHGRLPRPLPRARRSASARSTASIRPTCAIDELIRRVDANGVGEVVLATNPTMTGEATAAYLADRLREPFGR